MWTFIITLLAVVVTVLLLFAIFIPMVKRRKPTHERLSEEYIYRKEPHADQVTEKPNTLKDNTITKG